MRSGSTRGTCSSVHLARFDCTQCNPAAAAIAADDDFTALLITCRAPGRSRASARRRATALESTCRNQRGTSCLCSSPCTHVTRNTPRHRRRPHLNTLTILLGLSCTCSKYLRQQRERCCDDVTRECCSDAVTQRSRWHSAPNTARVHNCSIMNQNGRTSQ